MRASSLGAEQRLALVGRPSSAASRRRTARAASSSGTSGTPISCAFSAGRYGSWPSSRASKARARDATREPTWPRPDDADGLAGELGADELRLLPLARPPSRPAASGIRRSSAKSTANVCSTAETTLPVGELRTSTPRAEAAGTSTLSTPTPARPTTVSFGAAAKSAASTFVALRTSSASASASAASSSSRETPGEVDDLVARPARSSSSPAGEIFSATTTRLTPTPPRSRRAPRAGPRATRGPRRPCGRCGRSTPSTCRSRRRS